MIEFDYRCTECGKEKQRELLTVKKVSFLEMGMSGKAIKTRTVDWLCPDCLVKDPAWQLEKGQAPGRLTFNNATT